MTEFCDPTLGICLVGCEFDVREVDKNSSLVRASNMLVKCHGEPA